MIKILVFYIFSQSNFNFYYSNPLNALYFLHPGFLDVSKSEGIIGASYNPAALHFGSKYEVATFYSTTGKSKITFELPFGIDSIAGTEIPEIKIPFDLNFEDRGGFDFVGGKAKLYIFDIGISYSRDDEYGVDLFVSEIITQNISLQVKDTLSHNNISEIPSGTYIPVTFKLKGDVDFPVDGSGGINAKTYPIFWGLAKGLGPVAFGLGFNIKRYSGDVDLRYSINGKTDNLTLEFDTTAQDNNGNDWEINLNANGNFDNEIFSDVIRGNFSGTQIGFITGLLAKTPLLKAGVSLEYSFPFKLSGGIYGNYKFIEGISEYVLDTNQITVDTSLRTIDGNITIDTIKFNYSHKEHEILKSSLNFPGTFGIKAGANLNLMLFNLNLSGGIDIPSAKYAFGKAYFVTMMGLGFGPLELRTGSVFSWRYLKYEDLFLFTPPTITVGIGGNISAGPVDLYLGARTTPLAGVLSGIKEIGGEGKLSLNPFKTAAYNFGIRVKI